MCSTSRCISYATQVQQQDFRAAPAGTSGPRGSSGIGHGRNGSRVSYLVRGQRAQFVRRKAGGDAGSLTPSALEIHRAAKVALATAQQKLSAAQASAKAAHESLENTVDSASNKDFTDRIADAIDSFFGLMGGS